MVHPVRFRRFFELGSFHRYFCSKWLRNMGPKTTLRYFLARTLWKIAWRMTWATSKSLQGVWMVGGWWDGVTDSQKALGKVIYRWTCSNFVDVGNLIESLVIWGVSTQQLWKIRHILTCSRILYFNDTFFPTTDVEHDHLRWIPISRDPLSTSMIMGGWDI